MFKRCKQENKNAQDIIHLRDTVDHLLALVNHKDKVYLKQDYVFLNKWVFGGEPAARARLVKEGYYFSHNYGSEEVWIKTPKAPKAKAKSPKKKPKARKGR